LLLVKDEGSVARPLRRIPCEEGYPVEVSGGVRALARAESQHLDVVILDVGLPGMRG
jgi:DNA-binding response OmpR family regulator